jgi:serine/threonine protein phosphatase 1
MRILAIGDIHGCGRAFDTLLALVAPTDDDTIVTLGDYVDRGPDSFQVIERLIALNREKRLVALRGNHELMLLRARDEGEILSDWWQYGGQATLASYASRAEGPLVDVPESHWHFFEKTCVDWHETERHFFVHANAQPDLDLNKQSSYMLFWEHLFESAPHCSGKVMICGHTQQRSGIPLNLGHAICIDTWAYGDGWLTCLDVSSGQIWQANQRGRCREGWLSDLAALSRL